MRINCDYFTAFVNNIKLDINAQIGVKGGVKR